VKSWNQLCAGRKPLTLADIVRGFRSWTIHTHGASSTISACAEARTLSRSVGTNVSCAFVNISSIFGLLKWPQFQLAGESWRYGGIDRVMTGRYTSMPHVRFGAGGAQ